ITRKLDSRWIKSIRRWTIFSWLFLTLGNIYGAKWAYVELGWGGYWAWDPVENSSFMPWLTGTAFLHSIMIQERRGMLKVWNMILIITTFLLTIFGTFLTRSGVLSSVHSFAESNLGPLFVGFIILTAFVSITILISRLDSLKSETQLHAVLSRESTFLFNNLILVGSAFSVFWGTIFPLISEAVRGVKVTVGPPFFNQINIPIGLTLLLLTGICPLIAWRKATFTNFRKNFLYPLTMGVVSGAILFVLGIRSIYPLLSFSIAIFVFSTIILEFIKGSLARRRVSGESLIRALINLINKNKRRYGGYIIHLGIILIFVGITGSAFNTEKQVFLKDGENTTIKDYELTYKEFKMESDPEKFSAAAVLSVKKKGKYLGDLQPEKRFHRNQEQPHTEVAIRSTLKEDLYIILAGYDKDKNVSLKIFVNPLVQLLWLGTTVIVIGTIIAVLPDKRLFEKEKVKLRRKRIPKREKERIN
ncbi:MAG: heme lyase CcmF/NrfE family subunit, partial [Fidelibacterota bacterium]